MTAIAIAEPRVFSGQVERPGRAGAGHQVQGADLELVHRPLDLGAIERAPEVVKIATEPAPVLESPGQGGVVQADVRDAEVGRAGVARHGERLERATEVGRAGDPEAVVAVDRVHADIIRERPGLARLEEVGDGHDVGEDGAGLVLGVGVAREQLQRARRVPAPGMRHRAEHGELVRELGVQGQQLGEAEARGLGGERGERASELGGGVGLGVIRIEMATTPAQPDDDDGLAIVWARGPGPQPEEVGQGERGHADQPGLEEFASRWVHRSFRRVVEGILGLTTKSRRKARREDGITFVSSFVPFVTSW